MSPATARSRVASAVRRARPVTPSPRLTLLAPPASTRYRLPFAALCAAVLVASLLGVLVINLVLSRGAYAEHVLENRRIALVEDEQDLSERLAVQASPAVLSERARELGMVPNVNPAFIRMSDGVVLGSPAPAEAGKPPAAASIPAAGLDVVPEAPPAAQQAAQQAAEQEAARAQAEEERATAEQAAQAAAALAAEQTEPPPPALGDGAVAPGTQGTP